VVGLYRRRKGGLEIIGDTFHPLTKTREIHHLDSQEDSGLKTIEFGKGFFIEIVV
jgi:hypothetical protein